VVSRADLCQADRAPFVFHSVSNRAWLQLVHARLGLRILEHNADGVTQRSAGDLIEYCDRLGKNKAVGNELGDIELALRDQFKERLHIAVGCPAHIACGIILAAPEVIAICDTCPHGPAETKIDLLAEPRAPVELNRSVAQA